MSAMPLNEIQSRLEALAQYDRVALERATVTEIRQLARGVIADVKKYRKAALIDAIMEATANLRASQVEPEPVSLSGESLEERVDVLIDRLIAVACHKSVEDPNKTPWQQEREAMERYHRAIGDLYFSWQATEQARYSPTTCRSNFTYVRQRLQDAKQDYQGFEKVKVSESVTSFLSLYAGWTRALSQTQNLEYQAKLEESNTNQATAVGLPDYFQHCRVILSEPLAYKWYEVSAALALVTGRRMAEIHCSGSFSRGSSPTTAVFTGQLKMKDRSDSIESYEIPILAPWEDINQGIQSLIERGKRFRTAKDCNRSVSKSLSRYMQEVPMRLDHGDGALVSLEYKDLRGIYASICNLKYRGDRISESDYFSQILGHSLKFGGNTFRSYTKFDLKDSLGELSL